MAVMRWDPLQELFGLQQRMNRLFEQTLSRTQGEQPLDIAEGSWAPPIDIYETADRVVLRVDIPGVKQEDLDIRVENNHLLIRGERRLDPQMQREDFLRIERPLGTFTRSFSLPPSVDPARISAEYRNGVLEVTISKKPEVQGRSVKVAVQ